LGDEGLLGLRDVEEGAGHLQRDGDALGDQGCVVCVFVARQDIAEDARAQVGISEFAEQRIAF
jgi:hypothetical protein